MGSTVIEQILAKSRMALLGGTPLIYIQTDSDTLIEDLVTDPERPLVVLLERFGESGRGLRPLALPADRWSRRKIGKRSINWKCQEFPMAKKLPVTTNESTELYSCLQQGLDISCSATPCIWTYRMPETEEEQKECVDALVKYVRYHDDQSYEQYAILQSSAVILYASEICLPQTLYPWTEFIEVPYPDEEEIAALIRREAGNGSPLTEQAYLSRLCTDFLGFSGEEIQLILHRIQRTADPEDTQQVETIILDRKKQKLQGGLLELAEPDIHMGGLQQYKNWIEKQRDPITWPALYTRQVGTPPPRGVLLCGIPGCGKSQAAKYTAAILEKPLLRMDMGRLVNMYQGESERQMREALQLAEAMAPCVLWIDELEKAFSGTGRKSESTDRRIFGTMLTWMQENRSPCFIFATANDIGALPDEFFRSGRFDALFSVYLPVEEECAEIFLKSMERAAETAGKVRTPGAGPLFEAACMDPSLYIDLLRSELAADESNPQIVIGSDIQQLVTIALRQFASVENAGSQPVIRKDDWMRALRRAISMPEFSAWGSSEENRDGLAVRYCRLLRKGFIPAAGEDRVLFPAAFCSGTARKGKDGTLPEISLKNPGRYDLAVYACLGDRIINTIDKIEEYDRELKIEI